MGEIVRYKRDVWGEEVILGVSWDLLWVVAVAVLILLAAHAIVMAALAKKDLDRPTAEGRRVVRHESIDRIFHWLMAASMSHHLLAHASIRLVDRESRGRPVTFF